MVIVRCTYKHSQDKKRTGNDMKKRKLKKWVKDLFIIVLVALATLGTIKMISKRHAEVYGCYYDSKLCTNERN